MNKSQDPPNVILPRHELLTQFGGSASSHGIYVHPTCPKPIRGGFGGHSFGKMEAFQSCPQHWNLVVFHFLNAIHRQNLICYARFCIFYSLAQLMDFFNCVGFEYGSRHFLLAGTLRFPPDIHLKRAQFETLRFHHLLLTLGKIHHRGWVKIGKGGERALEVIHIAHSNSVPIFLVHGHHQLGQHITMTCPRALAEAAQGFSLQLVKTLQQSRGGGYVISILLFPFSNSERPFLVERITPFRFSQIPVAVENCIAYIDIAVLNYFSFFFF